MAFVNRYTATECGAMTFTGNTLGLSGDGSANQAGTAGTAGTFITLDSSSTVDAYPPPVPPNSAGTTLVYQDNGSEALLSIPANSTILYAELIWGGLYQTGNDNIIAVLNDDILFSSPSETNLPVTPDATTANEFNVGTTGFYMRSANVTSIVQAGGSGTYSAGSIPAIILDITSVNHAGWTLAVIYTNNRLPNRSMNLYVGADGLVNQNNTIDIPIAGFTTPPIGDIDARVLLSAQEGDAEINGDQALFGPDGSSLTNLSGPRNPAMNFFGSQIADITGNLNTNGSYGTFNQTPGTPGSNVLAGRQGWDITNVSAFNYLPNNQSSALFRFASTGDFYMPNALGVQIDLGDPVIDMEKEVSKTFSYKGDILTYTITITNNGVVEADNPFFVDDLPLGAEFITNSVTINNVSQPGFDPEVGFPLGPIPVGDTKIITFNTKVTIHNCFLMNEANVMFSCGKTATSNSVLTTICTICCKRKSCCSCT
ncbi:DUF11 domain-containing protein [Pseudalkalibacillus hwajinpoensis]|nr:DUF11 domain-containing protein [Pseudalkalibacillus hwajinpoensis]